MRIQQLFQRGFSTPCLSRRGFTLIELMVVITIIAVLATIGAVVYSSTQKAAQDGKRKLDVEAIDKAYQLVLTRTAKYTLPQAADFQGNVKPTRPEGGDYFNVVTDDEQATKFVLRSRLIHPKSVIHQPVPVSVNIVDKP